ncbi:hypothetical protein K502DRAFT_322810 [Neoconidiobolus thromboides FSU 785]|nr:hypothetical protein K502DRAFT_322810 [Neoconidiobolus thromboides FSU 785]
MKDKSNSNTNGSLNGHGNKKTKLDCKNVLFWYRTDMRTLDNRALEGAVTAVEQYQKDGHQSSLICLFIASIDEWKDHDCSLIKIDFFLRNIRDLQIKLREYNIPLIFKQNNQREEIPNLILELCNKYNIEKLFFNIEYEVNERKRDKKVSELLNGNNIQVIQRHDQCGIPPGEVVAKSTNQPYTVYTPFKNTWNIIASRGEHLKISKYNLSEINNNNEKDSYSELFDIEIPKYIEEFKLSDEMIELINKLYPSGEVEANKRLDEFVLKRSKDYKVNRDIPSLSGTSILSPYLTSGVISVRQCINKAIDNNIDKLTTGNLGITTWISELIWRDFYRHVLVAYPRVSKNQPFKLEAKDIAWEDNEDNFKAWCEGKTGYPIVDAGMRQLNSIGWMHNRLRMITAMFLSKDLLIDWRKGEQYFMQNLIDGDLASNNGGWQWSASTGTDAQPYFRVFNPKLQSEKVDPTGEYIKKWVPELKHLDGKSIHDPFETLPKDKFEKLNYPKPIVNHAKARIKAIEVYKIVMKKSK